MICNKCNHKLPEDSEFCQYCGNKIEKIVDAPAEVVVEEPKKVETPVALPAAPAVPVAPVVEDEPSINDITPDESQNTVLKMQTKNTVEAMDTNSKTQPNSENDFNFGLVPEKPIYTLAEKDIDGEIEYLNNLRTPEGEKIKWTLCGSTNAEGINGIIHIYDIYLLSGQKYQTIYINMYGKKSSTKTPIGFGIQKTQPVKNKTNQKKITLDIINILILILPSILSIAGLSMYYYGDLGGLYSMVICCGIIAIIFKILNITKLRNNSVITILTVFTLLIMLIPCCAEEFWDNEVVIATFILLSVFYLWICELCKLINLFVKKYRGSQNYKMKCYKKINIINDYLERGVISQEEFNETRKQIISKIK